MKKIKNYISIAFLLVVGATFSTQINSAIDWLLAVDYVALGNIIGTFSAKIADALVSVYDWAVALFNEAPAAQ